MTKTGSGLAQLLEKNREMLHIHQYGIVPVQEISFHPQVRELCALNYCGHYGRCWMCPPAVGNYEECRERILQYAQVFVFTTLHPLKDSYDMEGMLQGRKRHAAISREVTAFIERELRGEKLILSGDGCTECRSCTYPDRPCRFPTRCYPSVESYGVQVNRLAESAGVNYINGENTVTYFGCICFH